MAGKLESDQSAKRQALILGEGRGDLKMRDDGTEPSVSQHQAQKKPTTGDKVEVEEEGKSIRFGSVDPLERGSTQDKSGNYVAKTREVYQPSKKIPRHALATYVPVKYAEGNQPAFQGDPVLGLVNLPNRGKTGVDKRRFELKPNDNGEFPRIYVKAEEEVEVRLLYPEADKNAKYAVSAQDGGLLDDGFPSGLLLPDADSAREVAFRFAPSANEGTHRVVIRSTDGNVNVLDFWVGEDWAFAQPSTDASNRDAAMQRIKARQVATQNN